MKRLLNLIEDENGQISIVRAMALIFVISYVVADQKHIWLGGPAPDIQSLLVTLGSIGFKVIQKPFEKKKIT